MKTKLLFFSLLFPICITSYCQMSFLGNVVAENNDNITRGVRFIDNVDMNNDGIMDILSIGYDHIKWFEVTNNESNPLVPHIISDETGLHAEIGDMDGDGDNDLIIHYATRILYLENLQDGIDFSEPIILFDTENTSTPVLAFTIEDMDTDGDLDIIYSFKSNSSLSSLHWLENSDGFGNFVENIIDTYSYSEATITGDIDGDNDIDIITFNSNVNQVESYKNDGELNFTKQQITNAKSNGYATLHLNDIDNDGDLDLIVTDRGIYETSVEEIKVLKNDGLGNFSTYQTALTTVFDLAYISLSDIDNDGDVDILFAADNDNKIGCFKNTDGNGTFDDYEIINNYLQKVSCIISYDYDSDGDSDILTASPPDDAIALFENIDGQGTFSNEQLLTSMIIRPSKVLPIDIDGDSDLDVVISSSIDQKLTWYENVGDGNFGPQHIVDSSIVGIQDFIAEDLDNDGDIDIMTGTDELLWYENIDGQGNFGLPIHIIGDNGGTLTIIKSADFDNDGDLDIIYNDLYSSDISWRENLGSQSDFSTVHTISSTHGIGETIEIRDFNNDGNIDFLIEGSDGIAWYSNDGLGNFSENIVDVVYEFHSLSTGDIDGDGDYDIALSYLPDFYGDITIGWYENIDGLGSFGEFQEIDSNVEESDELFISDVNGDGNLDILYRTFYDRIYWYENSDGLGVFTSQNLLIEMQDYNIRAMLPTDVNEDSKTDIIIGLDPINTSSLDFKVLWHKNLGLESNKIQGFVKYDALTDGCIGSNQPLSGVMVISTNNSETLATFTLSNGYYQLFPEIGNYMTTAGSSTDSYYDFAPNSYSSVFDNTGNIENLNFCGLPLNSIEDLSISIFPITEARPGFDVRYQIVFRNTGTTTLNGNIVYQFDGDKLDFLNSSQSPSSITTSTLTYNYVNLLPYEIRTIDVNFNCLPPPTVNIDDILLHAVTMSPESVESNTFAFNQLVIGSYDPNDIQVLEGEQIPLEDIDKYLHYIIRFQNTGTASAINVAVENMLDDKLDWTSMQLESMSHNGRVEISNGNEVTFIFENINLPDSTSDEPNSHGYIAYKIKPKQDAVLGDIFYNTADIFFDFNAAITTNTVSTEIVETLSTQENEFNNILIYPNPTDNVIYIKSNDLIDSVEVYNLIGQKIFNKTLNLASIDIDMSSYKSGMYLVKVTSGQQTATYKVVKE